MTGFFLYIFQVNEFPDFLSGAERENTQHIVIKYMTKEVPKGKKRKPKDKSNEKLTPTSTSSNLTYRGSLSLTSRSSKRQITERKTQSLNATPNAMQYKPRRSSIDAEVLRDALESEAAGKKKGSKKKKSGSPRLTNSDNLATTLLNRYSSSKYERARELPRPLPNPSEEWDENGDFIDKRKKQPLKLSFSQTGELHLALEKLQDEDGDNEYGTRRLQHSPSKSFTSTSRRG